MTYKGGGKECWAILVAGVFLNQTGVAFLSAYDATGLGVRSGTDDSVVLGQLFISDDISGAVDEPP